MNHLENSVIIITGASSGIGAAAAKRLARDGAKLVLAARNQEKLDTLVHDIVAEGGTAVSRITDVTEINEVEGLAAFAVETYGRIDILINNAGLMLFSYWKDVAVDDWQKMIDTNIHGYLNGIAAVLPRMREQSSGHILNMSSVAGHEVGDASGVYSATKFFIRGITDSLRKEVGVEDGIQVSMVSPGVIDTGWSDKVTNEDGKAAASSLNDIAITPESVADAVAYVLNQPSNVTVNDLIIHPTTQPW